MTINPTGPAGGPPPRTHDVARDGSTQEPQTDLRAATHVDRVEISSEARALAAEGDIDRVPFTGARLHELRELIASGHYDRPDVITELARRLADSGDLR